MADTGQQPHEGLSKRPSSSRNWRDDENALDETTPAVSAIRISTSQAAEAPTSRVPMPYQRDTTTPEPSSHIGLRPRFLFISLFSLVSSILLFAGWDAISADFPRDQEKALAIYYWFAFTELLICVLCLLGAWIAHESISHDAEDERYPRWGVRVLVMVVAGVATPHVTHLTVVGGIGVGRSGYFKNTDSYRLLVAGGLIGIFINYIAMAILGLHMDRKDQNVVYIGKETALQENTVKLLAAKAKLEMARDSAGIEKAERIQRKLNYARRMIVQWGATQEPVPTDGVCNGLVFAIVGTFMFAGGMTATISLMLWWHDAFDKLKEAEWDVFTERHAVFLWIVWYQTVAGLAMVYCGVRVRTKKYRVLLMIICALTMLLTPAAGSFARSEEELLAKEAVIATPSPITTPPPTPAPLGLFPEISIVSRDCTTTASTNSLDPYAIDQDNPFPPNLPSPQYPPDLRISFYPFNEASRDHFRAYMHAAMAGCIVASIGNFVAMLLLAWYAGLHSYMVTTWKYDAPESLRGTSLLTFSITMVVAGVMMTGGFGQFTARVKSLYSDDYSNQWSDEFGVIIWYGVQQVLVGFAMTFAAMAVYGKNALVRSPKRAHLLLLVVLVLTMTSTGSIALFAAPRAHQLTGITERGEFCCDRSTSRASDWCNFNISAETYSSVFFWGCVLAMVSNFAALFVGGAMFDAKVYVAAEKAEADAHAEGILVAEGLLSSQEWERVAFFGGDLDEGDGSVASPASQKGSRLDVGTPLRTPNTSSLYFPEPPTNQPQPQPDDAGM